MIKNLKDAMEADINRVYISDDERRRIIRGDIDAINYMKQKQEAILYSTFDRVINGHHFEEDSYTRKFLSKFRSSDEMMEEIKNEFSSVRKYLNNNDIFHEISKMVVEDNFKKPNSLKETMFKVIDYNTPNYDIDNKGNYEKIKRIVKSVLEKYLYEKNAQSFSLKNGSYLYVVDSKNGFININSKIEDIENEMYNYVALNTKDDTVKEKMNTFQGKIDTYANFITSTYLEEKGLVNKNEVKNEECNSFDQAVYETIAKHFKYDLSNVSGEEIKRICDLLFDEYFNKNNINAFTSTNGARNFVINYKGNILNEMKKKTNLSFGGEMLNNDVMKDTILNNYSHFLSNQIKNGNTFKGDEELERFKKEIYLRIMNMNVNDNYKHTLLNYVKNEDYDNLWSNGVLSYEETSYFKKILNNNEEIKKGPRI